MTNILEKSNVLFDIIKIIKQIITYQNVHTSKQITWQAKQDKGAGTGNFGEVITIEETSSTRIHTFKLFFYRIFYT